MMKTWLTTIKRSVHNGLRVIRHCSTRALSSRADSRNPLSALPICDPHFHVWDVTRRPNPNLGELGRELPVYSLADHLEEAKKGGLNLVSGVHVEAVVGQSPGGYQLDAFQETREVMEQFQVSPHRFHLVPFLDLQHADLGEQLERHRAIAGSRMVTRGDYLTGGCREFQTGLALLAKQGLSFELQCNWFQLSEAASCLQQHPGLVIVLNHLGCLKLGAGKEENACRVEEWRRGMEALAALPQVHVKLSMLDYLAPGWQKDKGAKERVVAPRVRETIDMFGPSRCMVASNFPVDRFTGRTTLGDLYRDLWDLLNDRPTEDIRALFHDTATRVYKLAEAKPSPS